jgi:hypothetical protein
VFELRVPFLLGSSYHLSHSASGVWGFALFLMQRFASKCSAFRRIMWRDADGS